MMIIISLYICMMVIVVCCLAVSYLSEIEVGIMPDTAEDEQNAAFVRFLSIIYQVICDKVFECKFHFRQCATLRNCLVLIMIVIISQCVVKF